MGGARNIYEGDENAYKILIGKPERNRPLGKILYKFEADNKIDLKETGCEGIHWIHLAQNRDQWRTLVNMEMKRRVA